MDHYRHSKCTSTLRSCSTPFGINEWITARFDDMTDRDIRGCSTPFGINEWITRSSVGFLLQMHVLNAFRHQRMDHTPLSVSPAAEAGAQRLSASTNGSQEMKLRSCAGVVACSTPFGINEWITRQASERFLQFRNALCSTPFGINEWITCPPNSPGLSPLRAQRLSASTNGSRFACDVQ